MRFKRRFRQAAYLIVFACLVYFAAILPPFRSPAAQWAARAAFLLLLGYTTLVEPRRIKVRTHRVRVKGLPPDLQGLTVIHLTDFHWGSLGMTRSYVAKAVRRTLKWEPDLLALTGDFIARNPKFLSSLVELLRPLQANYGAFAVLGNQDRHDRAAVRAALTSVGFHVLDNENVLISVGRERLLVVGVSDPATRRDDLSEALRRSDARSDFTLLLAHSPDIAAELAGVAELKGRPVDLALVGHTHSGQCRVPLLGSWVRASRDGRQYVSGWYEIGATRMYVNSGIGHTVPFRFRCPPEIAVFVLAAA